MSKTGLKHLNKLKFNALSDRYSSMPTHAIPQQKYTDKTANKLQICIVDYINLIGGLAERRSNTGRYIQPKTYTNVFGKEHLLQKGKYIKGTGLNGTADVSASFKGQSIAIEVKIGKDRMSQEQKDYRTRFEASGGVYIIAKNFQDFYDEFNACFGL